MLATIANDVPANVAQAMKDHCSASPTDACCGDPCGLVDEWNAGNNEYNFVLMMTAEMKKATNADEESR